MNHIKSIVICSMLLLSCFSYGDEDDCQLSMEQIDDIPHHSVVAGLDTVKSGPNMQALRCYVLDQEYSSLATSTMKLRVIEFRNNLFSKVSETTLPDSSGPVYSSLVESFCKVSPNGEYALLCYASKGKPEETPAAQYYIFSVENQSVFQLPNVGDSSCEYFFSWIDLRSLLCAFTTISTDGKNILRLGVYRKNESNNWKFSVLYERHVKKRTSIVDGAYSSRKNILNLLTTTKKITQKNDITHPLSLVTIKLREEMPTTEVVLEKCDRPLQMICANKHIYVVSRRNFTHDPGETEDGRLKRQAYSRILIQKYDHSGNLKKVNHIDIDNTQTIIPLHDQSALLLSSIDHSASARTGIPRCGISIPEKLTKNDINTASTWRAFDLSRMEVVQEWQEKGHILPMFHSAVGGRLFAVSSSNHLPWDMSYRSMIFCTKSSFSLGQE